MAFLLPTFNLPINIWHYPNVPPAAPDLTTVGNLAFGRRSSVNLVTGAALGVDNLIWLLLPAGTDVRDAMNAGSVEDKVEVGAGSGRFYLVSWVEDAGGGFSNEHRVAMLRKYPDWPIPFPRPSLTPPITAPTLLASGASADGVQHMSLTYSAPPGLLACVLAAGGASNPAVTASTAATGRPSQDQTKVAAGGIGFHEQLLLYSWIHPGGTDTITFTTAINATFLAVVAAMPGSTFDNSNGTSGTATPTHTITTTGALGPPASSMAGFSYSDGTNPTVWTAPYFPFSCGILSQTVGGLGPLYLSTAFAFGLLPGTDTAIETQTVPGVLEWLGVILVIGP